MIDLYRSGLPLVISGPERAWKRELAPEVFEAVFRDGELSDDRYREGIWRSKINISFVTKSNQDEFTQKSFEIAGCGGFLLAERSDGHMARFREDEEAVFFSDLNECIEKIKKYLPEVEARERIAAAGRKRAIESGYDNDSQMRKILERVAEIAPRVKGARTK